MPHKYTFHVPPLLAIIHRYKQPGETWIDPFAGLYSPAEITNDLNPDVVADYHLESLPFVSQFGDAEFDGAIFDPPYSLGEVMRSYKGFGSANSTKENPTGGFPKTKDQITRVVRPGGYVVSYGWNTVGMGKKRGFEPVEYLICSHGGNRNDTLVTVERRLAPR